MGSIEEQEIEIDALKSIYPDEFSLINESPIKFEIFLKSQPVDCGPDDEQSEFETSVNLCGTLPLDYPEIAPEISISDSQNLDDLEIESIEDCVKQQIEDNLGMSMIFAICSEIQSCLTNISEAKLKAKEAEIERRKREQEEIEMQRLIGTPVTVETFLEWKRKFDAEIMAKKPEKQQLAEEKISSKLTGKQLFLLDNKMDNSDLALIESGIETMEINESLFQEDDNFDEEELSDD